MSPGLQWNEYSWAHGSLVLIVVACLFLDSRSHLTSTGAEAVIVTEHEQRAEKARDAAWCKGCLFSSGN